MDKKALAALIEMSHAAGGNRDYVQGGGGNTSVKSDDGKTMAIKASGTTLAAMNEAAGWVELDIDSVLSIFDVPGIDNLSTDEREKAVLSYLRSAVVDGPAERPSVESSLHAMLGNCVIHTHPPAVLALAAGPGEAALAGLTAADEPPPLWIPYTDPGQTLAVAVRSAVAGYQSANGRTPQIIIIGNHGIFVSADTPAECIALHASWVSRCEEHFGKTAPAASPAPEHDPATVRKVMAFVRRAWRSKKDAPVFARLSADAELTNAALDPGIAATMADGALSPDQIVYTGAYSVYAKSVVEVPSALQGALDEPAWPRVMLVKGVGAFLVSDDPGKLNVIEETASAAAKAVRLASGAGGAHNLADASARFIIGWEVEHYRAKLMDRPAPDLLAGKVAVVTGAASGLGRGIADGLNAAGAAVAFCDIDMDGLAEATGACSEPLRSAAIRMNVTDEDAVRTAFDEIIRHWGGVDIVVCAAGIAPPFDLVDMPVDKWRLALEINLTGYFLVAREGARVMKAQEHGGAMVMVSSKSGLDASKANSAYNATKAGELHLMRGWALELGPDGIRVNAVAPGNVFEGSKIWNPDYIEVCAKKKGIKPEEVIPHYVSMTALNREIKRADVADAVSFLCSDSARCITGQTLVVDSGQVMVR